MKLLLISLIFLSFSCKKIEDESSPTAIIGVDDRVPVTDPWLLKNIGSLKADDFEICTAVVTAVNEVSSSLHCLSLIENTREYKYVRKNDGKEFSLRIKNQYEGSDIVTFTSEENFESFIPRGTFDPKVDKKPVLIGYDIPTDQMLQSDVGYFKESDELEGLYVHSLDTIQGQSGSPIISQGRLLAIHVGTAKSHEFNIAVSINRLSSIKVRSVYPDFEGEVAPAIAIAVARGVVAGCKACARNPKCRRLAKMVYKEIKQQVKDFAKNQIEEKVNKGIAKVIEIYNENERKEKERRARERSREKNTSNDNTDIPDNSDPPKDDVGDFSKIDDISYDPFPGGMIPSSSMGEFNLLATYVDPGTILTAYISYLYYYKNNGKLPSDAEIQKYVVHINNGGSLGFIKSLFFPDIKKIDKAGNNGTVSCDEYCAHDKYNNLPTMGMCHRARNAKTNALVHCGKTPGFGKPLTCSCLNDGFHKPGNNGTISCNEFCAGQKWGRVGICMSAFKVSGMKRVSCDEVVGTSVHCYCSGL